MPSFTVSASEVSSAFPSAAEELRISTKSAALIRSAKRDIVAESVSLAVVRSSFLEEEECAPLVDSGAVGRGSDASDSD